MLDAWRHSLYCSLSPDCSLPVARLFAPCCLAVRSQSLGLSVVLPELLGPSEHELLPLPSSFCIKKPIFAAYMATRQEYNQLQAFARIDGAQVALLWVVSFACFILQFSYPLLGFVSLIFGVASLLLATMRVRRFRDAVRGGVLSFGQAFLYGLLIYLYASLLFALAQYLYFQFIDDGFMVSHYLSVVSTDEYRQAMAIYGLTEADLKVAMDNITAMRPIEIAMQFFSVNVIMGAVLSLPVALIMQRRYNLLR